MVRNTPIEKLCPQCGTAMWIVHIPDYGRLWLCADCKLAMAGDRLFPWREQLAQPEQEIGVRTMRPDKTQSNKPCPECQRPMWAIFVEGYGTRHQCEHCRLTVMFGGAVSRWRNIPKNATPDDIQR